MLTAITVVHNTKDLLQTAIESYLQWADTRIIIINGSDPGSECDRYVKNELTWQRKIHVHNIGYNIGHGLGMQYALERVTTPYALIFDSDIRVTQPGAVHDMLFMAHKITQCGGEFYGIGEICQADENGRNAEQGIKYLHPYFMLLNVKEYFKWPAFVHHGAPCYKAMNALHKAGKSDMLIEFDVKRFVEHKWKGTRDINPPGFLKGWE